MSKRIIEKPELFFCLAGPVGVDLDSVSDALIQQLSLFGYDHFISGSNELRRSFNNNALMAMLSLFQIQKARAKYTGNPELPAHGVAYIIRQLKRPRKFGYSVRYMENRFFRSQPMQILN
jgi:cytidine deaminase